MLVLNYLFGYSIVILFILKISIHIRLEIKHNQKLIFAPYQLWRYVIPYNKTVKEEYINLKKTCNYLFTILVCLFLIHLINLVYINFSAS